MVRPGSRSAESYVAEIKKLPMKEITVALSDLVTDKSMSLCKRVDITEQVCAELGTDCSWTTISEVLSENFPIMFVLTHCETALEPIVDRMLMFLKSHLLSDYSVKVVNVSQVMQLVSRVSFMTKGTVKRFIDVQPLVSRDVVRFSSPKTAAHMLMLCARESRHFQSHLPFLLATIDQLTNCLPVTASEHSIFVNQALDAVDAVTELAVRSDRLLRYLSLILMEKDTACTFQAGSKHLCTIAYFFSSFRYPAPEFFTAVGKNLETQCIVEFPSVFVAVVTAWSFLVQGVTPPSNIIDCTRKALRVYTRLIMERHISNSHFEHLISVLPDCILQLKPYLGEQVDELEPLLKSLFRRNEFAMRLIGEVQVRHPRLHIGVLHPAGWISAAGLIDDDGNFVRWPKNLNPRDVNSENYSSLPGQPAALLVESVDHRFRHPAGKYTGILQCKCLKLEECGWKVSVIFMDELIEDCSWGRDYVGRCIDALKSLPTPSEPLFCTESDD